MMMFLLTMMTMLLTIMMLLVMMTMVLTIMMLLLAMMMMLLAMMILLLAMMNDDDAIVDKAGDWVGVLRPEVGDLGGHQGHDRRWSDVDVFFTAKTHYHQGLVISFKR